MAVDFRIPGKAPLKGTADSAVVGEGIPQPLEQPPGVGVHDKGRLVKGVGEDHVSGFGAYAPQGEELPAQPVLGDGPDSRLVEAVALVPPGEGENCVGLGLAEAAGADHLLQLRGGEAGHLLRGDPLPQSGAGLFHVGPGGILYQHGLEHHLVGVLRPPPGPPVGGE